MTHAKWTKKVFLLNKIDSACKSAFLSCGDIMNKDTFVQPITPAVFYLVRLLQEDGADSYQPRLEYT